MSDINQPTILVRTQPTVVGREQESQLLLDRCERARSGEGGIVWLQGEAGIGKTALMIQLRAWAEEHGFIALWGRHIDHHQAPPLNSMREALSQLFDIGPGDGPRQIESKIGALLEERWPGLALHRRALIHFLEPLVEDPATAATANQIDFLYHPLFKLLATIAHEQPLLLFLEDLHWADAITLDCLAYILPQLPEQPLLLIASLRPEEALSSDSFGPLLHQRNATSIQLTRLDLATTTSMVQTAGLGDDEVFCQRLHQLTEGVPLFIEQWLLECQNPVDGRPPIQQLAQRPEHITQTIARRLSHLSVDQLHLARIAAVIGHRFTGTWLQAVDGRPFEQILSHLVDLEQINHILHREASAEPHAFSFHHALLRQVLYEATPPVLRQQLHERVGDYLHILLPSNPSMVFEIGRHFVTAHRRDKAVELLYHAGQRAHALNALQEAQTYYDEALQAADATQTSALRADIHEALGNTILRLGEYQPARTQFEAALTVQHDALRRATLCCKIANTWKASDGHKHWHLLQEALKETVAHPQSTERAQVLALLMTASDPRSLGRAQIWRQTADYRAAFLRIARHLPDRNLLAHFLINYTSFMVDHRNANWARKRRLIARGLRLAEKLENWDLVIAGQMHFASSWRGEDLDQALGEGEKGLALAEGFLPPDHWRLYSIQKTLLQWSWGAGDSERIDRYQRRLDSFSQATTAQLSPSSWYSHPDNNPQNQLLPSYTWQRQPTAAWTCLEQILHFICRNRLGVIRLVNLLSRLLRLALDQDRQTDYGALIDQLQRQYPAYFSSLSLQQWALAATTAPPTPTATPIGGSALVWQSDGRFNHCQRLADDAVELQAAPGVGLARGMSAPCLLHEALGDFSFETRISPDSSTRRAGGIVVWNDQQSFIRFASGIDHDGQVTLGWHDGSQLRYVGVGYHPETTLYMRLLRRGRRYEGFVSADRQQWQTCGHLRFGDEGPVQVGLFAEANHEYEFPQPFPIRFTETRLWLETSETSALAPSPSSQSYLYPLPTPPEPFCGMIGQGRAFAQFRRQLEEVARSTLPLMIHGETGTGKELAAQGVHQLSGRKDGPYIPLNVAALPEALIESELFGHKRGAFTGATRDQPGLFAAAAAGSIFLDEIGELPIELQVRLLRVLDSGEIRALGSTSVQHIDTRIIAATNRDLAQEVAQGLFRQDLYFRFADPLVIPSLRDRREDIPHLVAFFLHLFGQGAHYNITREAMQRLEAHDWPDNIRGLKHVIERALLAAERDLIGVEQLSLRSAVVPTQTTPLAPTTPAPTPSSKRQAPSSEELQQAVVEQRGNVAALGRYFGVSRLTIYRWCEREDIDLKGARSD